MCFLRFSSICLVITDSPARGKTKHEQPQTMWEDFSSVSSCLSDGGGTDTNLTNSMVTGGSWFPWGDWFKCSPPPPGFRGRVHKSQNPLCSLLDILFTKTCKMNRRQLRQYCDEENEELRDLELNVMKWYNKNNCERLAVSLIHTSPFPWSNQSHMKPCYFTLINHNLNNCFQQTQQTFVLPVWGKKSYGLICSAPENRWSVSERE